ncbi:S8/S53 family peptidase [Nocardioides sp. KR10-350]|uniref:S8/S53 family peptidase n=1 Tax=Nocardioides cheoyonin TaxID=3156615 RepID=UPI0032B4B547
MPKDPDEPRHPRRDRDAWKNGWSDRRVLDPEKAVIPTIKAMPTAYVGVHLTVARSQARGHDGKREPHYVRVVRRLVKAAEELNWTATPWEDERTKGLDWGLIIIDIEGKAGEEQPDAWRVLQKARALLEEAKQGDGADPLWSDHDGNPLGGACLNHFVSPVAPRGFRPNTTFYEPNTTFYEPNTTFYEPNTTFYEPNGTGASGVASYLSIGSGGRQPVAYAGPEPVRRSDRDYEPTEGEPDSARRRPVVAMLDTGVWARHPWFRRQGDDPVVRTDVEVSTPILDEHDKVVETRMMKIGDPSISGPDWQDADDDGPFDGALNGIAGHATFVAGLIHQRCPEAVIYSWRVVPPDGEMEEKELLIALAQILHLVKTGTPIDVLNLSLSYYHETSTDHDASGDTALIDQALREVLHLITAQGVTVVCSAGNDATSRPAYPAAFGPWIGRKMTKEERRRAPIVSVGSSNPGGRADALFSNVGRWVRHYEQGAVVISTFPKVQGGYQPIARDVVDVAGTRRRRSSMDPDDFRSGFAIWSGTSFAAPITAGKVAAALHGAGGFGPGEQPTYEDAWTAVERVTELKQDDVEAKSPR